MSASRTRSARPRKTAARTPQARAADAPPSPLTDASASPNGAAPADAPAPAEDTRRIQPSSVINALQASLNEKAQQIRTLEDRIVMLSAVIAEQDEEIKELRKPRAVRRSKTTSTP